MNILRKQQKNKNEKRKKLLLKILAIIICIGAPILTYIVGGGVYSEGDGEAISLLYISLVFVSAIVFAVEDSLLWWLLMCLYATLWVVMLVSVPSAGIEQIIQDKELQSWVLEIFIYAYAFAIFVSGIFGLCLKFIIRSVRDSD